MADENEIVIPKVTCPHCQYIWPPRIPKPVKCPKCGRRLEKVDRSKRLIKRVPRSIDKNVRLIEDPMDHRMSHTHSFNESTGVCACGTTEQEVQVSVAS